MSATLDADLLIAGAGPAALALAHACVERDLSVICVDPDPARPWPNNYGCWLDELTPLGLDPYVQRRWDAARITLDAERRHLIERPYVLLDNGALKAHLSAGVQLHQGRAASAEVEGDLARLRLADGGALTGRLIVDATGHRAALVERPASPPPGFQTAYGVVADIQASTQATPANQSVVELMDFSPLSGGPPDAPLTFLYGLPLGPGRAFLEETVLVGRPAVGAEALSQILDQRLADRGLTVTVVHEVERCWIPMGSALPARGEIFAYGGAASMVQPATGYMMTHSLRMAPVVAEAIQRRVAEGRPSAEISAGAWAALWPRRRRRAWQMYRFGMEVLLHLPPADVRDFFHGFFQLPAARWQAYMAGTASVGEISAIMMQVFTRVPAPLKARLMGQSFTGHGARMWGTLLGG